MLYRRCKGKKGTNRKMLPASVGKPPELWVNGVHFVVTEVREEKLKKVLVTKEEGIDLVRAIINHPVSHRSLHIT
ncbi:hypothetical protein D3C80_1935340 [compost metagenome]